MTDDMGFIRGPIRSTTSYARVWQGDRHLITSPNQPEPVACFCPIGADHTEAEFYDNLPGPHHRVAIPITAGEAHDG